MVLMRQLRTWPARLIAACLGVQFSHGAKHTDRCNLAAGFGSQPAANARAIAGDSDT